MNTPAWLIAAGLFLWGWFVAWPWLGAGLALLLLAASLVRARNVSSRAFARVVDVCSVFSLLALVSFITTIGLPHALHEWLRSAPLWLFPLMVAQLLHRGGIPLPALLLTLRFKPEPSPGRRVDASAAYALLCALAATSMAEPDPWLYPAVAGFFALWLWRLPLPPGMAAYRAILLLLALPLGYAIHTGLYRLQGEVEDLSTAFISSWLQGESDPFRSRTRIGDLGQIKLGDAIVMRVRPQRLSGPLLLREAVYDTYVGGQWHAREGEFKPLASQNGKFRLRPVSGQQQVMLALSLPGGRGLLPLPAGTTTLDGLDASGVGMHPLGAVRVEGAGSWRWFSARHDDSASRSAAPSGRDMLVPDSLRDLLEGVSGELQLSGLPSARLVAAVERYFARNFRYSLYLGKHQGRTLADFLLRERRGHCEYFATATVLLLRQAGIPARYAVGYSAQEYLPREQGFVVRKRHAHAWTEVFVDGQWRDIDTTPAEWAEAEREAVAEWYRPVLDWVSWAYFELRSLHLPGSTILATLALLATLPWLWRWLARWIRRRRNPSALPPPDPVTIAWRTVESCLAEYPRRAHETPQAWLNRIELPELPLLRQLQSDYYRLRYDPAASETPDRDFIQRCETFIASARKNGGKGLR